MTLFAMPLAVLSLGVPPQTGTTAPVQVDWQLPVRRTVLYPPETELRPRVPPQLPPEVADVFENEFAVLPYYGAFAISKEFAYGYSVGANSLEATREIAMLECLEVAAQCRVVAEIVPRGYVPIRPGEITMAFEPAEYWYQMGSEQPAVSMAVSADGAYSASWGYGTQSGADAQSLADCEEYRISDMPTLSPYPCVLVPDLP